MFKLDYIIGDWYHSCHPYSKCSILLSPLLSELVYDYLFLFLHSGWWVPPLCLTASPDEYVYDLYAVKDDMNITDEDALNPFPL